MKRKQLPKPEIIRELEWIANSFMINGQIEAAEQIMEEIKYMRRRIRAAKSRERRSRDKHFQAVKPPDQTDNSEDSKNK